MLWCLLYVSAARCKFLKESNASVLELYRTCPSGKSGGSLGEFGPGQMVKEFNDVVFTTGKVRERFLKCLGEDFSHTSETESRHTSLTVAFSQFLQQVGKVEGPVKTQFGYHLILITKRGDESM